MHLVAEDGVEGAGAWLREVRGALSAVEKAGDGHQEPA